jgi:hypothetical protein
MSRDTNDSPVVYDAANRELRTVKDYFAAREGQVLNIKWEKEINEGEEISSGDHLAQIIWEGADEEPIHAPPGCTGVIDWINGQIEYEKLDLKPQALLRLGPSTQRGRRRGRRYGRG